MTDPSLLDGTPANSYRYWYSDCNDGLVVKNDIHRYVRWPNMYDWRHASTRHRWGRPPRTHIARLPHYIKKKPPRSSFHLTYLSFFFYKRCYNNILVFFFFYFSIPGQSAWRVFPLFLPPNKELKPVLKINLLVFPFIPNSDKWHWSYHILFDKCSFVTIH